jgi:hypothetical protein
MQGIFLKKKDVSPAASLQITRLCVAIKSFSILQNSFCKIEKGTGSLFFTAPLPLIRVYYAC